MFELDLRKYGTLFQDYGELRLHKNSDSWINLMNGDVQSNSSRSSQGVSVRTGRGGIWGFASSGETSDQAIRECFSDAQDRFNWLGSKQKRELPALSGETWTGEYLNRARNSQMKASEKINFLKDLDNYLSRNFQNLSMRNLSLYCSDVEKKYINSAGGYFHVNRPLYSLVINIVTNKSGEPISLYDVITEAGYAEDNLGSPEKYYSKLDQLYEHLRKKNEGVYAQTGIHDVVLDADLAGILSHEAIGHTTEADIVLKGSVAGDLLGEKVASELVTLVDIAHTYDNKPCLVPVYVDDEGIKGEDAVIIENGILHNFMHNRATAQKLGMKPQGNARAYSYTDEPLVRMRNTMILPGKSKIEDMIASVENGYYLIRSSNGQADSTSEFMFGVVLGYEIKKGKLGRAIKDTTISGVAYDVLKSITAISDEYKFNSGTCGKKQQISVGMGGPAIRCRVNIGGKSEE